MNRRENYNRAYPQNNAGMIMTSLDREHSPFKILAHGDMLKKYLCGERINPIHCRVGLTSCCNLQCNFCNFHSQNEKDFYNLFNYNDSICTNDVLDFLDDFKENGGLAITFCGSGECTIHPGYEKISYYALKKGIKIGLITNGTMLVKKEMIECVAQTHTWIRIGLNAGTEDTYEKITHCNGENFTRILNSIRILKEKAEIEEFRVGLNFVITLDNYKEIIQATKLAREAEAHYIRFEPEFYSALAHETIYTKIEEINSMLEKAKKLQTKEFEVSIPKLNRGAMTNTDSVEGDFKVCHYCNFVTALGADGSMYPCPQIHLNEKYCMGNAINDGYSKWIQSKDKENWYRKNRDRTILCKTCFYRPQNDLIEWLVTGELELDEVLKKYQEDVPMTIHKEFV